MCQLYPQVNHVDLSPNYAGTLFGITNMMANISGFLTPYMTGAITTGNVSHDKCPLDIFLATQSES